jgi:transcriptional regulator with XRE-family HTH domain
MKIFSEIGQRIRKIRQDKGLSQTEFANILGFSVPAVISRFEKGDRIPGIDVLIKLADLYKIDLHWLITGQTMDFKRALEAVTTQYNTFYNEIDEKHQAAKKQSLLLELKQRNNEPLTDKEIRALDEYKKKWRLLDDRLSLLATFKSLGGGIASLILENIKKEDEDK